MASLPSYLVAARPVPQDRRAAWYRNTAQTYASVMLWFAFWQGLAGAGKTPGGTLAAGLGAAIAAILVAGLLCHFLFYLVPGLLGVETGLPLYVVGASTYGARGSLFMPGLLMGLLQFGWIGVNAYAVSSLLSQCLAGSEGTAASGFSAAQAVMATLFAIAVAAVGLKGIQYVARVASFFPLIPLVVLLILAVQTISGVARFSPDQVTGPTPSRSAVVLPTSPGQPTAPGNTEAALGATTAAQTPSASASKPPMSAVEVFVMMCTVIVGFFATAGAAGADLAMNNRNSRDVHLAGLTGIALSTLVAGGLSVLIVAGAYGGGMVPAHLHGELNPLNLMKGGILDPRLANAIMILLAISSFPGGCFSAYIAATSFKTTMPKVNPLLSVGLGTLVSIILAVTGWAGQVERVFQVIGASFGPICGAMAADYLLSGRRWAGPRAGFNPAGWISWFFGFLVGAADFILPGTDRLLCPPVAAFVVGFVLYAVLAKAGLQTEVLAMPKTDEQA